MLTKFNSLSWQDQVKFIIEENSNGTDTSFFIQSYETTHNTKFETDQHRYIYSFLSFINIDQALALYDNIIEKDIIIEVIKKDHPHLNDLITVHDYINGNMSFLYQWLL